MDSLVLSSLVPLSGEGVLQEHVKPRNTHLCSVFFTLFGCVKSPGKHRAAKKIKWIFVWISSVASVFLIQKEKKKERKEAVSVVVSASLCVGFYQLESPRIQQELMYDLPPPSAHSTLQPSNAPQSSRTFDARIENFSRTRLQSHTRAHAPARTKKKKKK